MAKNWTDEESIYLVRLFHTRAWLWDSTHRDYKNRNKRHDGLVEIAVSFGVEKDEIERKIKNMTSHFWRERRKEKESMKTGSGSDEVYVSKWFAMQDMLFLADKNKVRKTVDTTLGMESQLKEQDHGVENADNGVIDEETNGGTTNAQDAEKPDETPPKTSNKKTFVSPKKPVANRKRAFQPIGTPNPALNEAVDLLKSINSRRRDKDEFDLFGEQVAIKLRNIRSPHAQFRAQNIINNALFEASIEMDAPRPVPFNTYNAPYSPTTSYPSPSYTTYQSPQYFASSLSGSPLISPSQSPVNWQPSESISGPASKRIALEKTNCDQVTNDVYPQ